MLHDVLLEPEEERGLSGVIEAEEDNLSLFVDEAEGFESCFEPIYKPHGWFTILFYTRMKKKRVYMDDSREESFDLNMDAQKLAALVHRVVYQAVLALLDREVAFL